MTEADYLRAQLREARMLIARAIGHSEAVAVVFPSQHTESAAKWIADANGFQRSVKSYPLEADLLEPAE